MNQQTAPNPMEAHEEVAALIEILHQTGQRLEKLTFGEVDTVTNRAGRTLLLQHAQEQLQHSESARQAAILNALPATIALLDTQGRILSVNEAWRNFAGANALQDPAYGVGLNYLDVCNNAVGDSANNAQLVAAGIRSVLRGEVKHFSFEYPCHTPMQQHWFRMTATPLAGEPPNGVAVMHEDVTAKKEANDNLLASEQRFREMAESIREAFSLFDVVGNRFLYISPAYDEIWGHSRERLYANPESWTETVHPDDRLSAYENYKKGVAAGRIEFEYRLVHPDGSIHWIESKSFPILDDESNVVRIASIAEDITERKQNEEVLQQQNTELQVLFDLLPAMIWFKDTENRILRVNKKVAEATGKSVNKIEGKPSLEIYPQDAAAYYANDLEVIRSGEPKLAIVETLRSSDGKELWVQTDKVPVFDKDGEVRGIFVMASDITERVRVEKELRASEEYFRFLNDLVEATRTLANSGQIMAVTARMLGEHLRASRCAYADVEQDGEQFTILYDYTDGCASTVGRYQLSLFGERAVANLHSGQTLIVSNVDKELLPDNGADMFNAIGIKAIITCPLVKAGVLRALMAVHQTTPRDWTSVEITTVQEVVERCWATIERRTAEENLAANEVLLRQFIQHAPAAIAMMDMQMRYVQTSARWIQDYHLADQEIIGKSHYDIFPDIPQHWKDIHQRVLVGAVERCDEDPFVRADGSTEWLQWEALPWRNAGGEIGGLILFTQVITGRKQAQIELNWRTAFFESLVMTSADGILVVDANGRKIVQNRRMVDLWKIPADIADDPDDSRQVLFVTTQVVDPNSFGDKVIQLYSHPEETSQDEITLKDGTILDRFSSPVLDNDGQSYGRIWSFRDITERKKFDEALRESKERFSAAFEHAPIGIALVLPDGHWLKVNLALCELLGYSEAELLASTFQNITHPDDLEYDLENVRQLIAGEIQFYQMEKRYVHARGYFVTALLSVSLIRDDLGQPRYFISQIQDITERKEAEGRIKRLNRVYALLSGINTLIVRVRDRDELFREACRIAVEAGGFLMAMVGMADTSTMTIVPAGSAGKSEELLTAINHLVSSRDLASSTMFARAIRDKKIVVSNDSQNDPQVLLGYKYAEAGVCSMAILPLIVAGEAVGALGLYAGEVEFFHDEELTLLTDLADDIAFAIDHIERREKLDYIAYYDALTGLANRSLFLDRVAQHTRIVSSGGHKTALFLIDIERFKNINDSLGQAAGDVLLKQVASWLTQQVGDAALVARVGSNLFSIVRPIVKSDDDLAQIIETTMAAFREHPFRLDDKVFRISFKAGVSLFPDDGGDANTLFRNAEAALKKAKSSGEPYLLYTPNMTANVAAKLTLENQLRQALDNEEFVLHYQPKINLASGKLTGAEALIRWNDPRTGLVPPGHFIPILEETGLIYDVGRWALRKAIADYLRWCVAGLPAVRIAVNVSPLQLRNRGFVDEVRQVIAIDPGAAAGLELEITESLIMENVNHNITSLNAIRNMGISIAIDDFGTGFSSLSYLAKLPVDTLKIDRSFVTDMMTGSQGLALISTIITLAHSLKLRVVAEGVEIEEQKRLLLGLGCDEMQGYLFSKPVPADIFEAKLLAAPHAG